LLDIRNPRRLLEQHYGLLVNDSGRVHTVEVDPRGNTLAALVATIPLQFVDSRRQLITA